MQQIEICGFGPIVQRVTQPSPEEIRFARKSAGLTQTQATALVSPAQSKASYRTWQCYEVEPGLPGHRAIPLAVWELFLLLTGQHPRLTLMEKHASALRGSVAKASATHQSQAQREAKTLSAYVKKITDAPADSMELLQRAGIFGKDGELAKSYRN